MLMGTSYIKTKGYFFLKICIQRSKIEELGTNNKLRTSKKNDKIRSIGR